MIIMNRKFHHYLTDKCVLLLALMMSMVMTTVPMTVQADVHPDWARSEVQRAHDMGIVPTSEGYDSPITRAEFAAFAVRLYERQRGAIIGVGSFTDTDDSYVLRAAHAGLVRGRGDGVFDPNGHINRQEAAALLYNVARRLGDTTPGKLPPFSDIGSLPDFAIAGVHWAFATAVMGGVGDNRFYPLGVYTRRQTIVSMVRVHDVVNVNDTGEGIVFVEDIPVDADVSCSVIEYLHARFGEQFFINQDAATATADLIYDTFPVRRSGLEEIVMYPPSFGGMYIDSDGNLVVLTVESMADSRPTSNTYFDIALSGDANIRYVEFSYAELQSTFRSISNFLSEYYSEENLSNRGCPIVYNIDSAGIDTRANRVEVALLDTSPQQLELFREKVVDHPALVFRQVSRRTTFFGTSEEGLELE